MNIQNLFSNLSVGFFKNREVTETPQTQEQEKVQEQTQAEESELQEVELAEEELIEEEPVANIETLSDVSNEGKIFLGNKPIEVPKSSNPMMQMMMKLMEMMMKLLQMMMGQQGDNPPEKPQEKPIPVVTTKMYAIPELD